MSSMASAAAATILQIPRVSSSFTVTGGLLQLRPQKIKPRSNYSSSSLLFLSSLPPFQTFAILKHKPEPKTVPLPETKDGNGTKGGSKLSQLVVPTLMALLLAVIPMPMPSLAIESGGGSALFKRACIGCHDAGGNLIQPGSTLFAKDLERNGVNTEEEIYNITYNGKGRMPGFGQKCTPRGQCTFGPRLLEEDIRLLAQFVKSQAEQAWPPIP